MKKIFKILFVFIAAVALFASCEEVETGFDKLTTKFENTGQAGLVFLNGNMLKEVENNSVENVTIPIKLQVWGPLSSAAETVNITVNTAASTAIAGTHYTLATTSVTIPAKYRGCFVQSGDEYCQF